VTDAVLTASRVLVAVAARSLAEAEGQVSLAQYRVLVVLASRGPQRLADLAEALAVMPSTTTRLCDRLVAHKLVHRQRAAADRREIRLALTAAGRQLVNQVTERRRAEIARLVTAVEPASRDSLVSGLRALSEAAGEVPERDWALGW
jgi:DNA-binding MarR family transcriptional regulator